MPLFACSKCNTIENTACGDYWSRQKAPLCSECSPLIGKWHGRFSRESADLWERDARQPHFFDRRKSIIANGQSVSEEGK